MPESPPSYSHADTLPLPSRAFRLYVGFWHVAYLGALAAALGFTLWYARAALGWREAALAGLVLAQAGLYANFFIRSRPWPLTRLQFFIYFAGSLGLWFLEWRLEPNFFWLVMTYMGQGFGLLPPAGALPLAVGIFVFVVGQSNQWELARFDSGDLFGLLMGLVSFTVVYLFIYYVSRTSAQRGELIVKLKEAQAELERAHRNDLELAALRERERLARDLHDSLGHALVALSVQLEAVQRLYRVDPERASAQIDELKRLTRRSTDELRRSLAGLRAPGLGERPLSRALQSLSIDTGQRASLEIDCRVADGADRLTPAVAETLWRAAQEALINVERHARARRVELRLDLLPDAAHLRVADDGLGLPPDAEARPGHYGLRGMRERVEGLGGTLSLGGADGAVVDVRLPVIG